MPNFADKIADIITGLAVELERLKAGQIKDTAGRLNELTRAIIGILRRNEQSLTGPYSTPKRREGVFRQATEAITDTYRSIRRGWPRVLERASLWYVERTANDINRAAGVKLYERLTDRQIQRIAEGVLIDGAPSGEWWGKQDKALRDRFIRQMREGIAQNETVDQLARRVRGTRARKFTDGIMSASKREADALVRTSLQAAANEARLKQYEKSAAVKALQHHSTLDARTTLVCVSRDGLMWSKDDKRPLGGHGKRFMNTPVHWQCRSVILGLTYSARELERMGYRIPDSTRASMDGQVPSDLTYEDWLKSKPEAFQRKVLGRGRWQLWQDGKLPFTMLIDQSNRPLRLDELR